MALTTAQRNKLPRSAFGVAPKGAPRSAWKYPMPTKAQARRAGIPEGQRQRTLNAAVAYSARSTTASSKARIAPVANKRGRAAGTMSARSSTSRRGSSARRGR